MSKCEEKIEYIFYQANIRCVREKTFSDLRKGQLRYDFYLPDLNILVEYDSELHFQEISKFYKQHHNFSHARENDRIKNSYALSHHIPLYRIPYWNFTLLHNVNDILKEEHLVKTRWHNDMVYREYLKREAEKVGKY